MKITSKLILGFSLLILSIISIILLSLGAMSSISNEMDTLIQDRIPKVKQSNSIINSVNLQARSLRDIVFRKDPEQIKSASNRITNSAMKIDTIITALKAISRTAEEKKHIRIIADMNTEYQKQVQNVATLALTREPIKLAEAETLLYSDYMKVGLQYLKEISGLIQFQEQMQTMSSEEAHEANGNAHNLLYIIGGIASIMGLIIASITIGSITKPLSRAVSAANSIAAGNMNVDLDTEKEDEVSKLLKAMKQMALNIKGMAKELNDTATSAIEGKLDKRADSAKFEGEYATIMVSFNRTLDAVIGPLNLTAEYVDRISKGDIPTKITEEYQGDFNEIKNNLNLCIDSINSLIKDANLLNAAAEEGNLDVRADESTHNGDYANIIRGMNKTLDNVVEPFELAIDFIARASRGDELNEVTKEYKGIYGVLKTSINNLRGVLYKLVFTMMDQSEATLNGRLDVRADLEGLQGEWKNIFGNFNKSLDAVINPLNLSAEYIDRISKGDIPSKIDIEMNGDFNEIKNNLNSTIDVMNGLLSETHSLIESAKNGQLDVRANSNKYSGEWGVLLKGVNQLIDSMVTPLNVTAEYVDRISKGDIPPAITDIYHGDFNEIKQNINQLIFNLNNYISEMSNMSNQHDLGEIDVVIAAEHFQGAFYTMAKGVNEMVAGHINVKKMALNIAKEYGNGNFDEICPELPGQKAFIKDILDDLRSNLINFNHEIGKLTKAASNGNLEARGNSEKFEGGWARLVEGVNELLQTVVEPMEESTQVLSTMATGDLTIRMTGDYKGDFLLLKNSINKVAESLNNLLFQVQNTVKTTAQSSLDITNTSESLAAATQEQSAQSDEVASAVEQMSRTVTENAMSAGKTAEVAYKNGEVAREGGEVVKQTILKMRDIANVVKTSAENIEKLGESSTQIGEIISVIDDIADQTNLLALNAAIEAARAGEQGRGFAVVADEVRKLAERTSEATKQIAVMIKGIQHETAEAVKAMTKGNEEVSSGIDFADKAGDSLEEILSSTTEVMNMVNQIAAASEEQSATSEQISKNVNSISKVTSESASRIEKVAKSAEDLSKLTNDLFSLMNHFKIGNGNSSPVPEATPNNNSDYLYFTEEDKHLLADSNFNLF